jgi:uncharacterized protein (TIGR00730 family)
LLPPRTAGAFALEDSSRRGDCLDVRSRRPLGGPLGAARGILPERNVEKQLGSVADAARVSRRRDTGVIGLVSATANSDGQCSIRGWAAWIASPQQLAMGYDGGFNLKEGMVSMDPLESTNIQPEALGEDEKHRPQPIDESPLLLDSGDLIDMMRRTVDQLEKDATSRGDLKILNRTLRELRYAMKVFQPYRRRRKMSLFGSARTRPEHPAYLAAETLCRMMAGHGWMVITGAGGGVMEAGHKGAGRELSMGLNIMLPFEQSANPHIDGDPKLVTLKYFFTRKLMFVKECSSVVCLPGGFGTIDETFEILTLLQTGKQTIMPLVFLDQPGGSFWKSVEDFFHRALLPEGLISPEDVHLYRVTDRVEEAVEEILNFYRVYHSMRFVDELLVLRVNQRLSGDKLERLNDEFSGILRRGAIEQSDPLPAELNEPEIVQLPRITLHFNRRNYGRLRQLINVINE